MELRYHRNAVATTTSSANYTPQANTPELQKVVIKDNKKRPPDKAKPSKGNIKKKPNKKVQPTDTNQFKANTPELQKDVIKDNKKTAPDKAKRSKGNKKKKTNKKVQPTDANQFKSNIVDAPLVNFIVNSTNEHCWPELAQKRPKLKDTSCVCNLQKTKQAYKESLVHNSEVQRNHVKQAEVKEEITDILLKITNDIGEVVVVPQSNWHAIVPSPHIKDVLFCSLCLEGALGEDGFSKHILEERHLTLLDAPWIGRHEDGLRQVSVSLYHCILCNMMIHDLDDHVSTRQHQLRFTESKRYATGDRKKKLKDASHLNQAKELQFEPELNSPHTLLTNSTYYCYKCEVDVPNCTRQIVQHKNTIQHKLNLQIYQSSKKKDSKVSRGTHNTDKIFIKNIDLKSIKNVEEAEIPAYLKGSSGFCTLCGVNAGRGNLEQHVNGKDHEKHLHNAKKSPADVVGYNVCEICHVTMPNNFKYIEYHYKGETHQNNVRVCFDWHFIQDLGETLLCHPCKSAVHKSAIWGHIRSDYHYFIVRWCKRKMFFCDTCEVLVKRKNRAPHIASKSHKLNVARKVHRL